jgi:hypothetical protein
MAGDRNQAISGKRVSRVVRRGVLLTMTAGLLLACSAFGGATAAHAAVDGWHFGHFGRHPRVHRRPTVPLTYDQVTLAAHPVLFLTMNTPRSVVQADLSGRGHSGTYLPVGSAPRAVPMPNGDTAAGFDGRSQYLQVADSPDLSVPKTGVLTLEAWIRPDTLQPSHQEGTGYVNFLGKGEYACVNQEEYEMRMYSKVNSETPVRPNRLSVYVFNLPGGEGSGSYVQEPMAVGQWIMLVEVINTTPSAKYPTGHVTIYKNGASRETVGLNEFGVVPQHGTAPFRVGSVQLASFFPGAIGKVAVFDYELTAPQVAAQYRAMAG